MVPAETLLADGQGALRQRLYFHLPSLNNVDLSQVVESPAASIRRNSFPCSQMVEYGRSDCKKCRRAIAWIQRSLRLLRYFKQEAQPDDSRPCCVSTDYHGAEMDGLRDVSTLHFHTMVKSLHSSGSLLVFQPSSTALASRCLWHRCVEKCGDHRDQPLGAVRERHMRRAGEHG